MEELEKEYKKLRNEEQDLLRNLKGHKDEDIQKGQAVRNQRALWDKTLEFRFLLQKAFSSSNRLPQALVDYNPSIAQSIDANAVKDSQQSGASGNLNGDVDEEWLNISQMHERFEFDFEVGLPWIVQQPDYIKSEYVVFYYLICAYIEFLALVSGQVPASTNTITQEDTNADPELLDDSEFYQQLLKEFFETVDPASSEIAFYAMKRLQTKKRKIVDRRASKSRKILYHVHEKIVNFMAPRPMNLSPDASMIFQNLFGLRTRKSASAL
ncbi:Protein Aatf [Olea europaea subsp. europaea]|uniref:Protein Aatf n=1 Tax=Olea europaea subsp. europaea TaxID=158383 RepID=A0A8S0R6K4_OLEEU|nr:Protein Aatf [Olea europaea subsp. europaea]